MKKVFRIAGGIVWVPLLITAHITGVVYRGVRNTVIGAIGVYAYLSDDSTDE